MKVIPREVERKRSNTWSREIRLLQNQLSFTSPQKEVLIGTLLGDASIIGTQYGKNYRLQIEQSDAQKEYVNWKYELFREWCLIPPQFRKLRNSWRFRTISHPQFTELRKQFYHGTRKRIPKEFERNFEISPMSLAVWFMDDGTVGPSKGYTLNSQNFTKGENEKLQRYLKDKFGLTTSLHKDKERWRIYILPQAREKFEKIITSYLLPTTRYKLHFFSDPVETTRELPYASGKKI